MADLVLEAQFKADQAALKEFNKRLKEGEGIINQLDVRLKRLKAQIRLATDPNDIQKFTSELKKTQAQLDAVNKAAGRSTSGFRELGSNLKDIKQIFGILTGTAFFNIFRSGLDSVLNLGRDYNLETRKTVSNIEDTVDRIKTATANSELFKATLGGIELITEEIANSFGIITKRQEDAIKFGKELVDQEVKRTDELIKGGKINGERLEAEIEYNRSLKQISLSVESQKKPFTEKEAEEIKKGLADAIAKQQELLADAIRESKEGILIDIITVPDDNQARAEFEMRASERAQIEAEYNQFILDEKKRAFEENEKVLSEISDYYRQERAEKDIEIDKRTRDQIYNSQINFASNFTDLIGQASSMGFKNMESLFKQTLQRMVAQMVSSGLLNALKMIINPASAPLSFLGFLGFAEGGYTGRGNKYDPAGVVHRGEVVWNQEDVQRFGGVNAVESIRPTAREKKSTGGNYFNGGEVVPMVSGGRGNSGSPINVTLMLDKHELGRAWFEPNGVLESINRSRGNPE